MAARPARRSSTSSPLDWRNRRALGFDMFSEPIRRSAMEQAAWNGRPSLSGPVRLKQETGVEPQPGVLIYLPIYRQGGQPEEPGTHPFARLVGWAYAPLRMGELVKASLELVRNRYLNDSVVVVFDGPEALTDRRLFATPNYDPGRSAQDMSFRPIQALDWQWTLGVRLGTPPGLGETLFGPVGLTAIAGLLGSLLACVVARLLVEENNAMARSLEAAEKSSRELALAEVVYEASPLAIVVTDPNGMILSTNTAFSQLSGYSRLEAQGHKCNLLRSGRHDEGFYRALWEAIIQRSYWSGEVWNRHRNGQIRRHELSITAVLDGNHQITQFVGMLQDVSERYVRQEEVRHQAMHDHLTGLPNRAVLMEQLTSSLSLARRRNRRLGLLFLDLNGFKAVNDSHGHAIGDQLLQRVATAMRSAVRESDILCRQGGEEFVLLVPDADSDEDLRALAFKLQRVVEGPWEDLPEGISISVSIGIACWPEQADSLDGLLNAADVAMYRAKHASTQHLEFAPALAPRSSFASRLVPEG